MISGYDDFSAHDTLTKFHLDMIKNPIIFFFEKIVMM